MELTPKQQIIELVNKSKNILLITHANPDGDALGSMLALYLVFKKLGKNVSAVCSDVYPKVLEFMPQINQVKQEVDANKDFIITLDTHKGKVERLGYKNATDENKLSIIITPKAGVNFTEDDVSCAQGNLKYDLIFVLDAPDQERLGKIYIENPNLFYEVPIINIDHHPSNSYFGKVNWVDLTATSTSEILVSLIESLGRGKNLLDEDIATNLLTGIITDTGSFQHSNTTPKSFTVAAQLVAAGAKQQEIVKHIFKTKRLSTLKIWGKVLSNIKEEKNHRFIYSTINSIDFKVNNADPSETSGVTDELLKTAPGIDFALLLTERNGNVHGSFRGANESTDVAEIAKMLGGGGHKLAAAFQINGKNISDIEDELIEKIKSYQEKKYSAITAKNDSLVNQEDIAEIED